MSGILHICKVNRCRSAMAEVITRAALSANGLAQEVPVGSAGTWTPGGEPIWPAAGQELLRRGYDPSGFRSRPIAAVLVQQADLILAATRELRDEVITLVPSALRRTFTWGELAWLLDGVRPAALDAAGAASGQQGLDRLRAVPQVAAARRGHLPQPSVSSLDVTDPVNRAPSEMVDTADRIIACVDQLVGVLAGQGEAARITRTPHSHM